MHRVLLLSFVAALALSGCVVLDSASPAPGRSQSATRSLEAITVGNNETVTLEAGTFEGTWRIEANHATVRGAGAGRTVIRGHVILDGNANTVTGLSIDGRISISGNTNDITGVDLSRAEVSVRGQNNRY